MSMLPLVIQIERTQERLADTCAFASSPVRIGRNPLSDLQLDESFVSQWHGVIRFDDEHTTYLDLGSTNPTLIDGQPIKRNIEIEVTDKTDIRIGSLRLHLLRVPADPELFGARRKTSFARVAGSTSFNNVAATMYLGDAQAAAQAALDASRVLAQLKHKTLFDAGPASGKSSAPGPSTGVRKASAPPPPPPPAAAASGLSSTGVVARERSVPPPSGELPIYEAAAQSELQALYREYARTRALLLAELRLQLEAAAAVPSEREALCEQLFQRYPELAHEPELRSLLGKLGIESWRTGVPDTIDWLRRLTGGLFPAPGQQTPINPALALERIGEVLEVWSSAFIELRTAHTQFCEEMALDKPQDSSLLYGTSDPKAVLAYLLNPDTTHNNKITELARAMADFALHPVALVSAVVEGARDVLQGVSPASVTGRGEKPGASFFGKLLGGDQRELWARYVKVFDELVDADRFTRKLFGRGFARKYYAITGGRRSLPSPPAPRPGASVRP